MNVLYDAGVLIAADRGERQTWVEHRVRLEAGLRPITTAPVVAQVSRSDRQALLHRFLRTCEVMPFAADQAHQVGTLAGVTATSDVVDAHVIVTAAMTQSIVLTTDPDDLHRLAAALPAPVPIRGL